MLGEMLVYWVLSAIVLLVVALLVPGFRISGIGSALVAVLVIGLLNVTLGWFLRVVTFPFIVLTFGLFLLVINTVVLKVAAALIPGFAIRGFAPAFLAAILLSILHILVRWTMHASFGGYWHSGL